MDFVITGSQIIGFCSFIAAVWGAWKIVKEIKKPNDDLKKQVEKHSDMLDNDNHRIKEVEADNKMILQCLLVIINHEITGNSIDKMKEVRNKLQDYLIDK